MKPGAPCTTTAPGIVWGCQGTGKVANETRVRSFERTLERSGGIRRVCLRGREILQKRYLLHAAGFTLGLLMRGKTGSGTPGLGRCSACRCLARNFCSAVRLAIA